MTCTGARLRVFSQLIVNSPRPRDARRYLFHTTMHRLFPILIFLIVNETAIAREPESMVRGSGSTCEAPHGNGNVYATDIVRHGDTLLMYYGGQGRDGHDRIHLTTSTDGTTWKPRGVVFAPDGINHVNDPSVVIVNGKFYMYYTRASVGVTDCIGLATSNDGRMWLDRGPIILPREKPAWDSLLVGRPSVTYDGNRFRLWYDGRADLPTGAPDRTAPKSSTSQRYVGYAESKDGISWKRHDGYVFANDAGGVHVSRVDGQYVMLIESRRLRLTATSLHFCLPMATSVFFTSVPLGLNTGIRIQSCVSVFLLCQMPKKDNNLLRTKPRAALVLKSTQFVPVRRMGQCVRYPSLS